MLFKQMLMEFLFYFAEVH